MTLDELIKQLEQLLALLKLIQANQPAPTAVAPAPGRR